MSPRFRFLKARVQVVFILDDGETLTEQVSEPTELAGLSNLQAFALEGLPTFIAAEQAKLDHVAAGSANR